MTTAHLSPATGTGESDWVRSGVIGFAESVLSIVPSGFAAYARIFHPTTDVDGPMRWAEVAERTGRIFHPSVRWPSLIGSTDYSVKPGGDASRFNSPTMGSLPRSIAVSLIEILRSRTSTPDHCWFAIWEGFMGLDESVASAPTFELPHRRYHLMEGPIDGLVDDIVDYRDQSPNLWWPNDRAWLVASELDFVSTYVGASRSCIEEILRCEDIEAAEVEPSQRELG